MRSSLFGTLLLSAMVPAAWALASCGTASKNGSFLSTPADDSSVTFGDDSSPNYGQSNGSSGSGTGSSTGGGQMTADDAGAPPTGPTCVAGQTCVDTMPAGWSGYVQLLLQAGGNAAACAGPYGFPQALLSGSTNPDAGPASCAPCTCGVPDSGAVACEMDLGTGTLLGGLVCLPGTPLTVAAGSCVADSTGTANGSSMAPTLLPDAGPCGPGLGGQLAAPLPTTGAIYATVCAPTVQGNDSGIPEGGTAEGGMVDGSINDAGLGDAGLADGGSPGDGGPDAGSDGNAPSDAGAQAIDAGAEGGGVDDAAEVDAAPPPPCAVSQACAPIPESVPEGGSPSGPCIYSAGVHECPTSSVFSVRYVVGALSDDRGCSCSCGLPSCPSDGYVEGYANDDCTGTVETTIAANTACGLGSNTSKGSKSFAFFSSHSAWTGACVPADAGPTGGVTIDAGAATTFCCKP